MSDNFDALSFLVTGRGLKGALFAEMLGVHRSADAARAEGEVVGAWRLIRPLGHGGTCVVYLAERADGQFEQHVALKIVRSNEQLSERLRRERELIAGLRHPAIVNLVDGGETTDGCLWFAMVPVFGLPIDEHVQKAGISWVERISIFDAVCDAVAYAHGRLLVHRDIKPVNIMVDEEGRPHLLDFGIAIPAVPGASDADTALTPAFASPEQWLGGTITTASDIFQLGALLRVLFWQRDGRLCQTLPKSPPAAVLSDLTCIIAHACEADPDKRYSTVAELRSDLTALRERKLVAARKGNVAYKLARWVERHRGLVALSGLFTAVLLTTLAVNIERIKQERDRAEASAEESRATLSFFTDVFRAARGASLNGAHLESPEVVLDQAADRLLDRGNTDPAAIYWPVRTLARVYIDVSALARAEEILAQAIAGLDRAGAYGRESGILHVLRAEARRLAGNFEGAMLDIESAQRLLEPAEKLLSSEDRAMLLVEQVAQRERAGDFAVAEQLRKQGFALLDDAALGRNLSRAKLLDWQAVSIFRSDLEAALRTQSEALGIYRELYGETSQMALRSERLYAYYLGQAGRNDEREALIRKGLSTIERTLGPGSEEYGHHLVSLAALQSARGRPMDAIASLERGIALLDEHGADPNQRVIAMHYLADAHAELGDHASASKAYRAALEVAQTHLPQSNRNRVQLGMALANSECLAGNLEVGLRLYSDKFDSYAASPRVSGAARESALENWAACLRKAGKPEDAKRLIDSKREGK